MRSSGSRSRAAIKRTCAGDRLSFGVQESAAVSARFAGSSFSRLSSTACAWSDRAASTRSNTRLVTGGRHHHLERHSDDQVADLEPTFIRVKDLAGVGQIRAQHNRGIARPPLRREGHLDSERRDRLVRGSVFHLAQNYSGGKHFDGHDVVAVERQLPVVDLGIAVLIERKRCPRRQGVEFKSSLGVARGVAAPWKTVVRTPEINLHPLDRAFIFADQAPLDVMARFQRDRDLSRPLGRASLDLQARGA